MCRRWRVHPEGVAEMPSSHAQAAPPVALPTSLSARACILSRHRRATELAAGSACGACWPKQASPTARPVREPRMPLLVAYGALCGGVI